MRTLGLFLLVIGALLIARPFVPVLAGLPLPVSWPTGVALTVVALVLLRPRRPPAAERDVIADDLAQRGFAFTDEANGWRARGDWQGRVIEIRRVRGYEASRFGLEWVVEVSVRGRPTEPWPLPPDQARLVGQRDHGVNICLPAVSHAGAEAGLAAAIDLVLAEIEPERQGR